MTAVRGKSSEVMGAVMERQAQKEVAKALRDDVVLRLCRAVRLAVVVVVFTARRRSETWRTPRHRCAVCPPPRAGRRGICGGELLSGINQVALVAPIPRRK